MLEFVKEIASKNAYSLMPVAEMDRGMFLDLIDECAINSNPLLDFQDKIVPESKLFDSYTNEEKDKISQHLYGGMRPDYLTPNKNHVKRDSITGLWKKLIQDPPPMGLGIKNKLYVAKYTGTDDKVDEGLDLKEVQHLYGHTSEAMTKRYNKRKRQIEAYAVSGRLLKEKGYCSY